MVICCLISSFISVVSFCTSRFTFIPRNSNSETSGNNNNNIQTANITLSTLTILILILKTPILNTHIVDKSSNIQYHMPYFFTALLIYSFIIFSLVIWKLFLQKLNLIFQFFYIFPLNIIIYFVD